MFYASPEVKVMISNEKAFINNALSKRVGSANNKHGFSSFGAAISDSSFNIYYYYYFYYPELPRR